MKLTAVLVMLIILSFAQYVLMFSTHSDIDDSHESFSINGTEAINIIIGVLLFLLILYPIIIFGIFVIYIGFLSQTTYIWSSCNYLFNTNVMRLICMSYYDNSYYHNYYDNNDNNDNHDNNYQNN